MALDRHRLVHVRPGRHRHDGEVERDISGAAEPDACEGRDRQACTGAPDNDALTVSDTREREITYPALEFRADISILNAITGGTMLERLYE